LAHVLVGEPASTSPEHALNLASATRKPVPAARGRVSSGMLDQPTALAAFTYGKVPLDSLDGALALDGDPELAAHFASLFTLPAKFYPPRR